MLKSQKNLNRGQRFATLLLLLALFLAAGCDQVTRHKVLTTVFDGVPRLPDAEEYCQNYVVSIDHAETITGSDAETGAERKGSSHRPFAEKRCNDCHAFEKPGGLIRPKRELCFVCHKDFIQGPRVHGPVAVGDCLACHHPHSSKFEALLLKDKSTLCNKCHQEDRLAAQMHDKVIANSMSCPDCHNPHFGQGNYFLD